MIKLNRPRDCKHWDDCSAPLCPFDKSSLENCVWYPDEQICKLKNPLRWIRAQKKIARVCKNTDTYFNYEMLNSNCQIRKGIIGLNPDKEEKRQLQYWLNKHPPKRILSKEEKERMSERFKKSAGSNLKNALNGGKTQLKGSIVGDLKG